MRFLWWGRAVFSPFVVRIMVLIRFQRYSITTSLPCWVETSPMGFTMQYTTSKSMAGDPWLSVTRRKNDFELLRCLTSPPSRVWDVPLWRINSAFFSLINNLRHHQDCQWPYNFQATHQFHRQELQLEHHPGDLSPSNYPSMLGHL
jgi:hypothetical protein